MRVGVVGAAGRMGSEVCRAVDGATDLELVAAVDPHSAGRDLGDVAGVGTGIVIAEDLNALVEANVEVAVEFTSPATVGDNLKWLLEHDIHAVVGATGISDGDMARAAALAADGPANVLVAPNFAIGAVLMMQFAAEAAKHLPNVEVIELHHDRKVDAPSGTALRTAELIGDARTQQPNEIPGDDTNPEARGLTHHGVPVHAVRLPGVVANQSVIFGDTGQTLTIRHDTIDRTSFMPGVLLACREVNGLDGMVVGLEHVL